MAVDGEALQIKDQYILGEIAQGAQDFAHLVGSSSLSEQRVDQGHLETNKEGEGKGPKKQKKQ